MPTLTRLNSFQDLQIPPTDRGVLVGMTGSGKTTLAEYLLSPQPFVAAIDPKGLLKFKGYIRYRKLKQAMRSDAPKIIYSPDAEELRNPLYWEAFFRWVYERRNTYCYIDEVYAVTDRDEMPPHYHAILTRGRERGTGLLSATQRPMRIPAVIMSESEFWYVFRLSMPGDRKKVEETINLESEKIAALPKQHFYFARADMDILSGPMKLNLAA
jgi:hypothetical protein